MTFFKSLFGNKDGKGKPIQPLKFPEGSGVESLNIKAKSKIVVGLPTVDPSEHFINAINILSSKHIEIKEIYIFSKKIDNTPVEPVLTLGIYFEEKVEQESVQQIMNNIVSLIETNIPKGQIMDIIILKQSELFNSIKSFKESLIYKK